MQSQNEGIVTLVTYSDLLGFGNLLASSNGTLDSAVGGIALQRIVNLRQSLVSAENLFPKNTKFFHLNDLVLATLDIEIKIDSMPVDAQSIHSQPQSRESWIELLDFLSASASLHQNIVSSENSNRIGPAGRTFVVLGRRWQVSSKAPTSINNIPEFQGNMALAEAYQADSLGSRAGFAGGPWDRFFVNDYVWHALVAGATPLVPGLGQVTLQEQPLLNSLGIKGQAFPNNLVRQPKIEVTIFHRKRTFHPLMSHHACEISKCILKT